MKLFPLIVLAALVSPCVAQNPLNHRHGVAHGKDYKQASEPYLARTPYTLEWHASETWKPSKTDPTYRAKDDKTCAHVYDADTGKLIVKTPWGGMRGSVRVPVGGRHQVQIFSLGEWRANIIEDKAMLEKAQREGRLKPGVVLNATERAQSAVGKRETVAQALAEDLSSLETERGKIGADDPARQSKLNALDEKIHLVKLAASRSSDVEDFEKRKRALIK